MTETSQAAKMIRKAYAVFATQYGAGAEMSITEITNRTDLTRDEIEAAVIHLMISDTNFHVGTESGQFKLSHEDRSNRLWIGNQYKDNIRWQ